MLFRPSFEFPPVKLGRVYNTMETTGSKDWRVVLMTSSSFFCLLVAKGKKNAADPPPFLRSLDIGNTCHEYPSGFLRPPQKTLLLRSNGGSKNFFLIHNGGGGLRKVSKSIILMIEGRMVMTNISKITPSLIYLSINQA